MKSVSSRRSAFNQSFFWIAVGALLAALCLRAEAQQPKVPLIGFLSPRASADSHTFEHSLRELGYVNDQNIRIEYRYAEGNLDRLPALAAEFVQLKVNVIVAQTTTAARAARQATDSIPIVMTAGGDPIHSGLIASLARPGGNVTGVSNLAPELDGKRLELLKESFPKIVRVAFMFDSSRPSPLSDKETARAARAIGVQLVPLDVKGPKPDIDGAFVTLKRERGDALVVGPQPVITTMQQQVIRQAGKNRIPAMYPRSSWTELGGLMSYSASERDLAPRLAVYVDKILKGAKPADLPVEQPTKYELVINLKTAKQIGLTIPPNMLARADRVIK